MVAALVCGSLAAGSAAAAAEAGAAASGRGHRAVAAAPPILDCDPGGLTVGDQQIAARLDGTLRPGGAMATRITPYQVSCARMVVRTIKDLWQLEKHAAVIAITTAIVESHVQNLDGGTGSSVGVFQQTDIWGPREDRLDVERSTDLFIDAMLRMFPGGAWKNRPIGEVCQKVQRSAFPERYQPEATDAEKIVSALGIYPS
ncbi:hypothetical protein OHR68_20190 [Spirillospora sp. NBC_00431]